MSRRIVVIFEAEYELELEEPYASEVVAEALAAALGFTGLRVLEVIDAEGASDL